VELAMNYILMHQNIKVAEVVLNSSNAIAEVVTIFDDGRLPMGTKAPDGKLHKKMLNAWWYNRRIPLSRAGLKDHLEREPFLTPDQLQMKSWGLSLSDHYWMNPVENLLSWDEVNFFDNDFSEDVGNMLLGKKYSKTNFDLVSPDNTSDGWLKKKWKIVNGERVLIKAGSAAFHQEPYNEAIATLIMSKLGINHIPYHTIMEGLYPFSVCANFVTKETELVSAWYVMQSFKQPNHVSLYEHYINCCEKLEIKHARMEIEKMIIVDYLMVNEDRHQNNFGLIRDVRTLKFISVAPIFDTGTALWHNQPTHIMGSLVYLECKPFKRTHEEQLKLVTDFSWLDFDKLNGIAVEIKELLNTPLTTVKHSDDSEQSLLGSFFLDAERRNRIIEVLLSRIDNLKEYVKTYKNSQDDIKADVLENVAYSGK